MKRDVTFDEVLKLFMAMSEEQRCQAERLLAVFSALAARGSTAEEERPAALGDP